VVGVHTPEFPFERDSGNVREAAEDINVEYPIALDPDYAVWDAFANRYWPAAYFADAEGQIRHHQFGEGGYDECERVIQQLLREAGREGCSEDLVTVSGEASRLRPIGRTSNLPRPTSATSKVTTSRLPAASPSASPARTPCRMY